MATALVRVENAIKINTAKHKQLASIKFGDLTVFSAWRNLHASWLYGVVSWMEAARKMPRLEVGITAIYTPEEREEIGKYAAENSQVRSVRAFLLVKFKSPTRKR